MVHSMILTPYCNLMSLLSHLRWHTSKKKLFVYIFVSTVLLILINNNLNRRKIFCWLSSLNSVPQEEITMEDIMLLLQHDLPPATNWTTFEDSSSGSLSTASLEKPQAEYCVGQTLDVRVDMRNHRGQLKTHGGDFILARIHSPNLQASAAGEVTDLHNGSYRVRFTLFWPGEVQVSVLLMHSSEAVQIMWRSRKMNYKKITHIGTFVNGSKVERTECAFQLYGNKSLCEYRDQQDGEYYACFRPPSLTCDSIDTMQSFNTPGSTLSKRESLLLHRRNSGVMVKNNFQNLLVTNCSVINPDRTARQCVPGMIPHVPSGYFLKNRWFSSYCQVGNLFSLDSINSCLKGKTVYLKGDSTMRQWIQYLNGIQKEHKTLDRFGFALMMVSDPQNNYTIKWKNHGHPWVTVHQIKLKEAHYISRDLDDIGAEEENVVVVISVGQHFRAYIMDVFIRRLLGFRRAIWRLQARNPGARVFIKLENTRTLDTDAERFSDWQGHLQNQAQRMVFRDLGVGIVDAWEMTVAANTFDIHPNPTVISNEIAVFLSYLCHAPEDSTISST